MDHAIVTDHVGIYSNPHVSVDPAFNLVEVDGLKVEKASTVPKLTRPIVRPGTHVFKAELLPSHELFLARQQSDLGLRGRDEITFKATVEAGKVYLIYWKEGQPALLEVPRK
jgi:hypothetical protein